MPRALFPLGVRLTPATISPGDAESTKHGNGGSTRCTSRRQGGPMQPNAHTESAAWVAFATALNAE
jgi:hypothetical protein